MDRNLILGKGRDIVLDHSLRLYACLLGKIVYYAQVTRLPEL